MASRRRWFIWGIIVALAVALLSPLASSDPDGLERVAIAQGFAEREIPGWAERLPFARLFAGYTLRGLADPAIARIAAGVIGTLAVFGLSWGVGEWLKRSRNGARER